MSLLSNLSDLVAGSPAAEARRPHWISVVLTTYNAPEWLEKVLWGYAAQDHTGFEILIADDGSTVRTRQTIERVRAATGLRLRHVWHDDDGFRKCTILNRAIRAATGDYLIFSDGDCVPRRDFVGQHYRFAEPGRFLSGGYYKLPLALSEQMTADDIRCGRAFQLRWLRAQGLPWSMRWLRLIASDRGAAVLNRLTTTRATWNGNNSSGWTEDIWHAGGFDERMRYGGLDRELGERLENAGVRGKQIRFHAVCLHLDHARGYANPADWKRNHEIRHRTRTDGRTRTDHGLGRAA